MSPHVRIAFWGMLSTCLNLASMLSIGFPFATYSVVSGLFLAAASDGHPNDTADARPPCFSLPQHFEPSAWRGNWVLDRQATDAFFAPNCPFYRESGKFNGDPDQDEHRLAFQPHSCKSPPLSALELRLLLANRTVMFFGDSVSRDMATNLACALWKATGGAKHATSQPTSN